MAESMSLHQKCAKCKISEPHNLTFVNLSFYVYLLIDEQILGKFTSGSCSDYQQQC